MSAVQLILASASPRRRALLNRLKVRFDCDPAHIDETLLPDEHPSAYVQRMAREKALTVTARYRAAGYAVLAADTSVVLDGEVLGKPENCDHGLEILTRLSGRRHTVLTAICLQSAGHNHLQLVTTEVEFAVLSRASCEAYLATDEPFDKAGSYGIQGLGGAFVRAINGSYSNVVGLPLCETWELLRAHGIATALDGVAVGH